MGLVHWLVEVTREPGGTSGGGGGGGPQHLSHEKVNSHR